jgi:TonB family protein
MKYLASFITLAALVCLSGSMAAGQAGRRRTENPKATYPVPLPDEPEPKAQIKKAPKDLPDQKVYQCLYNDRPILDVANIAADGEEIVSGKELSSKPRILQKPQPAYTSEARRNGTGGKVILKVLLSSTAKVTSVRVVQELPDGLTESAVRAACLIRFEPAMKDARPVSYYVIVEYGFWNGSRIWPRTPPSVPLPPRPSRP